MELLGLELPKNSKESPELASDDCTPRRPLQLGDRDVFGQRLKLHAFTRTWAARFPAPLWLRAKSKPGKQPQTPETLPSIPEVRL